MLTDPKGGPAEDASGKRYTHKLQPNEDAREVAARMTKELRKEFAKSLPVNGFGKGPITYPKIKIA